MRYRLEWWDEDTGTWRDADETLSAADDGEAAYGAACYGRSHGCEARAVLLA